MTRADAIAWCYSYIEKYLDYDGKFGTQCVDFFNFYYRQLTGLNPYSQGLGVEGAKDLANCRPAGITWVANNPSDPNQLPADGDIIIMDGRWGFGGGYGHVGVSHNTDQGTVRMVDETPGNPVNARSYAWRNVVGWFVPNVFNGTEEEMITDAEGDILRIGHSEIGGWDFNDTHTGKNDKTFMDAWKGRPLAEFIRAQWNNSNSASFRNYRNDAPRVIASLQQQLADVQTALKNEQAKPPKEVVKEVEKIVEKIVEVPVVKEIPMTDATGWAWLVSKIKGIFVK